MRYRRFEVITTLCQEFGVQIFCIDTICFEIQPRRRGTTCLTSGCSVGLSTGPFIAPSSYPAVAVKICRMTLASNGLLPCTLYLPFKPLALVKSSVIQLPWIGYSLFCLAQNHTALPLKATSYSPVAKWPFLTFPGVLVGVSIRVPLAQPSTCQVLQVGPFRLSWEYQAGDTRAKGRGRWIIQKMEP